MLSDQNLACSYTFIHFLLRILGVCGGQCCMRHVSSCVLRATEKVRGIPWVAERGGLVLGQKEGGGGGGRRNPPRHTSLPTPPKLFLGKKIIQWYYKNISLSFLCVQISNLVAWLFKYFSQLWRLCCYRICKSWPLWHRHKKKKKEGEEDEEEVAEQKKPVLERIPRKKEEPDSISSPPLAPSLLSHNTGEQEVPYSAWKIITHEMTEGLTWRILRLMITTHEK